MSLYGVTAYPTRSGFSQIPPRRVLRPEEKLQLAVLDEAITTVRLGMRRRTPLERSNPTWTKDMFSTLYWLLESDEDYTMFAAYSFQECAHTLGANCDKLRAQLTSEFGQYAERVRCRLSEIARQAALPSHVAC